MFSFIGISIILQNLIIFALKGLYKTKKNIIYSKLKAIQGDKNVDKVLIFLTILFLNNYLFKYILD